MKKPTHKHFPVKIENQPPHYFALCGHDNPNPKEFVNPQSYKPENVAECCKQYKKVEST